jgi:hypothetical protein
MNRQMLSDELRRKLKQAGLVLSEPVQVETVEDPTEEGLVAEAVVSALLLFSPVNTGSRHLQAKVAADKPHVQVISLHNKPVDLWHSSSTTIVTQDDRYPERLTVECNAGEELVVRDNSGHGMAVANDGGRIVLAALSPAVDNVFYSDVAAWSVETGDIWLQKEVMARLERDSDWQKTVAVALFQRHSADRMAGSTAEKVIISLQQGEVPGTWKQAEDWVRSRNPRSFNWLGHLALAEIARLEEQTMELSDAVDLNNDDWMDEFIECCHRRDDLEAVRNLLNSALIDLTSKMPELAELVSRMDKGLTALDSRGNTLADNVPAGSTARDFRLARLAVTDWFSWWIRTAAVEIDDDELD